MKLLVFAYACALAATVSADAGPASAQPAAAHYEHKASGFAFPEEYDGMARRDHNTMRSREIPDLITAMQYARDKQLITVFLFRATYPNAALWFERIDAALQGNEGAFRRDGTDGPRQASFGSAVPNGLVETFGKARRKLSIGYSVTQHGRYLLVLQVTSGTRNRAELHGRIADFAAAIRFPPPTGSVLPLDLPGACAESGVVGEIVAGYGANKLDPEAAAKARAEEIARRDVVAELKGEKGLATNPSAYCRPFAAVNDALAALPRRTGTVYRAKDGSGGWITLLGVNGHSLTARPLDLSNGTARHVVYASRLGTTNAALFAEAEPSPSFSLYFANDIIAEYNEGLLTVPIP